MTDAPHNPFPPGVAEAMAEAGHDVSDVLPSKEPPPTQAIPKHDVRYLAGGKPRFAVVELDCPLEFDGREFLKIGVKRLTVAEVGAYFDELAELRKTDADKVLPFPIFIDDDGQPVPAGLLDALVDDDMTKLNEVAVDFLPRRFRDPDPEAETSAQPKPSAGERSVS